MDPSSHGGVDLREEGGLAARREEEIGMGETTARKKRAGETVRETLKGQILCNFTEIITGGAGEAREAPLLPLHDTNGKTRGLQ